MTSCNCELCYWARSRGFTNSDLGGCTTEKAIKISQEKPKTENMSAVNASSRTGNVANIVNRMSQSNLNPRPDIVIRKNPSEKKKVFKARFSYEAAEIDELTFDEGSIIEGIEKGEDGWMKGKLMQNGKVGMFPLNFVEAIEESDEKAEKKKEPTTLNNHEEKSATSNARPSNKRLSSSGPPTELYANIPTLEKNGKDRAKVMYKYEAEQPDEISLDSGTVVNIVKKQVQDDGWIEVEFNGKTGLFPENFIKILPPTDEKQNSVVAQPPTPPPVKPKPSTPSGTAPSGIGSAGGPDSNPLSAAATGVGFESVATTATSSKIKELQQQVFAGRQPPVPGSKPIIRPKTIIGTSEVTEKLDSVEGVVERPHVDSKITSHPTRDRPRQGGKRPPSMNPAILNDDSGPTTTSFPVKESTPPVTVTKPALVPKTEQEPPKQLTKSNHEAVIVPSKKSVLASLSSTSSIQSNSSSLTQHDESEFVSRKEFNLLLKKVDQLQRQLNELLNKSNKI
ncbi:hypothetical protein FO519_004366 [Halicephalobus sp. NKZ332]|nr:hypothetical protein FO519_004366 [Halicephalobus sp. NKZ332]